MKVLARWKADVDVAAVMWHGETSLNVTKM
jgi:hypothetical protein